MFARFIEPVLRVALNDRPVTFLQGPRQSGKTSLVRQLNGAWETAEYRTFDDLATLSAARNDPAGFMAGFRGKLRDGVLVYIPNRYAFHARDAFAPDFDADGCTERWSRRVFVTANLDAFQLCGAHSERMFDLPRP